MGTQPYEVLHPHLATRTEFERAEHQEDKAPHLESMSECEDRIDRESGGDAEPGGRPERLARVVARP